MVAKVHALGRSFAGVAAYCLHDAPERDEGERPETDERVEWADTRNLASRPERAAAQAAGRGVGRGAEAGEAGPPLHAELGQGRAAGAVRSDPAELKRLAMAKLEREHWRARAQIGQHHTYKAVAAETEAGHVYGRADVEAHRAALGMQAVERQEREAARPPPPQRMPDRGPSRDRGGGGFER